MDVARSGVSPELVALARPEPREGATMIEGNDIAGRIVGILRERGALVS